MTAHDSLNDNTAMDITHVEHVPAALDGERLDRVVAVVAGVTRAVSADLISAGRVQVNGRVVTKGKDKIALDDLIEVAASEGASDAVLTADATVLIDVVYVDEAVIVINKQPDLVVHPGAGNQTGTLVHGLLHRFPELADLAVGDAAVRPGIVHRLDKGTSGLLMVGRTQASVQNLVAQLSVRSVSRRYQALALGRFDARSGVVDAPVGRSERDPTRMTVSAHGKEAVTHYEVQATYDAPDVVSFVECWLETGRTHQIRVHLAAIGHPVVGDPRYGGKRTAVQSPRPFLHAYSLAFTHPVTGTTMQFTAPLPRDLEAVLSTLS